MNSAPNSMRSTTSTLLFAFGFFPVKSFGEAQYPLGKVRIVIHFVHDFDWLLIKPVGGKNSFPIQTIGISARYVGLVHYLQKLVGNKAMRYGGWMYSVERENAALFQISCHVCVVIFSVWCWVFERKIRRKFITGNAIVALEG
jgi:hypothetical protein